MRSRWVFASCWTDLNFERRRRQAQCWVFLIPYHIPCQAIPCYAMPYVTITATLWIQLKCPFLKTDDFLKRHYMEKWWVFILFGGDISAGGCPEQKIYIFIESFAQLSLYEAWFNMGTITFVKNENSLILMSKMGCYVLYFFLVRAIQNYIFMVQSLKQH